MMIEVIQDMPSDVIGLKAKGQVTRADYANVLTPEVDRQLRHFGRLKVLYHLGNEFHSYTPGAMWADLRMGFLHFFAWKRCAVVTDVLWLRKAVGFFRIIIPGAIKLFPNANFEEAKQWISQR